MNLPSLRFRRLREDIICLFRICKTEFLRNNLIKLKPQNGTRGHSQALAKERFFTKQSKQFLLNRVCDLWNSFPEDFDGVTNINMLKNFIENFFANSELKFDHTASIETRRPTSGSGRALPVVVEGGARDCLLDLAS